MWRYVSKSAFLFGFGTFLLISSSYARISYKAVTEDEAAPPPPSLPAACTIWLRSAMFATQLFLQTIGMMMMLMKRMMLTFGSLILQSPIGRYRGSQLPWPFSSSSLEHCFSPFHILYSQITWRVIVLRHMVSCSWVSSLSFLAFMRLELLTIHGEEHQGTPSHPSRIIRLPCFRR